MTQSEQSNEIIYQLKEGYWAARFTLEGRQFYGQTRHEVIEQILHHLEQQVQYYKSARISMDGLEGPKEVIEQTLNYLEQQEQEYNEAKTMLRKALEGPIKEQEQS
jgi:hypothetical protein